MTRKSNLIRKLPSSVSSIVALGSIVIVVLVGFGIFVQSWLGQKEARPLISTVARQAPFQTMKLARLTTSGRATQAVISPDGKWVVYVVDDKGKQGLWVRQVAASSDNPIVPAADVDYLGMAFSPDGNFVYYASGVINTEHSDLYKVPMLGGTPRKLINDVDSAVSFSPDGQLIVFVRDDLATHKSALMIADSDGGHEQRLTVNGNVNGLDLVSWAPDGKVIACVAAEADQAYKTIVEVPVSGGDLRPLNVHGWFDVLGMGWFSDGSGLALSVVEQPHGTSQIWRLSYPDGQLERVTNDLSDYRGVSQTADSRTIATIQSDADSNIWVLSGGDTSSLRQVTSGRHDGEVSWTPDGKIIYESDAGGNRDIWIIDADGNNPKQLTANTGINDDPSASPDGRYIAFSSTRDNLPMNIWRVDADGSNPKRLTEGKFDSLPIWSVDSKSVVYTSDISQFSVLRRVPVEGGEAQQLTNKKAYFAGPSISPDGKLIACFYLSEEAGSRYKIALIPFKGGEPVSTFNAPTVWGDMPYGFCIRWRPDGRSLTYINNVAGVSNIWSQPLEGGAPKQLTNFQSGRIFWFDWSRDGKLLALARGNQVSDVVLIRNFR